jgi:hypothetical protein
MTRTASSSFTFADEIGDNSPFAAGQQFDYLDRCRKVVVGPSVSLVFENHQTLSFRIREVEGLSRHYPPMQVRKMLAWYEGLMPGRDRLTASVSVRRPGRRPLPGLNTLAASIAAGSIVITVGDVEILGDFLPMKAGDRVNGAQFWAEFHLTAKARDALADFTQPAVVSIISDDYIWDSEPLDYEIRHSLVEDLDRRRIYG